LLLQHVDVDLGAGGVGRPGDHVGQSLELLVELFFGVEAAVDGEPCGPRNGVEAGAGAGLSTDDEHRPTGCLALDREAGSLLEQLVGERGQRLGDSDHVLEGVDALVDVAHVRFAAMGSDAQRDGAAARVPDHATGRGELDQLGREAQPLHRVAQHARAPPQLATGRVLGGNAHERFEQCRQLVGPAVQPGLQLGSAIRHVSSSLGW